ncbi:MAG: DUF4442 domain-containing protein [Cyclobacteriaceae bacterium]|nr:YiiD C-terminal domain-containing protein [Cyclobacteriaceae bacterium]MCH8516297.1 DUF4442 domain-containing protein [Cyclobacteriaceae bacterium]
MKLLSQRRRIKLINYYPPFIGAGVKVTHLSKDFKELDVAMKLTWYNRNLVGVHFGGSLFSMCDPFYMLMLMQVLGRDYIVWDKAASIRFRKPGKGTVKAAFRITDEKVNEIRTHVAEHGKGDFIFHVDVTDSGGDVVAALEKTIYVRRKDFKG